MLDRLTHELYEMAISERGAQPETLISASALGDVVARQGPSDASARADLIRRAAGDMTEPITQRQKANAGEAALVLLGLHPDAKYALRARRQEVAAGFLGIEPKSLVKRHDGRDVEQRLMRQLARFILERASGDDLPALPSGINRREPFTYLYLVWHALTRAQLSFLLVENDDENTADNILAHSNGNVLTGLAVLLACGIREEPGVSAENRAYIDYVAERHEDMKLFTHKSAERAYYGYLVLQSLREACPYGAREQVDLARAGAIYLRDGVSVKDTLGAKAAYLAARWRRTLTACSCGPYPYDESCPRHRVSFAFERALDEIGQCWASLMAAFGSPRTFGTWLVRDEVFLMHGLQPIRTVVDNDAINSG